MSSALGFVRHDVTIPVPGADLAAWWFQPTTQGPWPAVVMAHGFGAVKEMFLDRFAERFAGAGLAVLVFDHRGFGDSGGELRQEADPEQQARDYRHVVTWLRTQLQVARERIGLWGTSYSGGQVLQVAAQDRRIRCVVAQVPIISGSEQLRRRTPPDQLQAVHEGFADERDRLAAGQAPTWRALIPEANGPSPVYHSREAVAFYGQGPELTPTWSNRVTLSSVAMSAEFEPGAHIQRISPTPLLMVVATHDTITPTDLALAAYERALQPKQLVLLSGDHFTPYQREFEKACSAALAWFLRHLAAGI